MKELLVAILIIVIIAAIVFLPFALIWSLNTLFNLSIAYEFKQWAAACFISFLIGSRSVNVHKND
jgi:hypothetical protein